MKPLRCVLVITLLLASVYVSATTVEGVTLSGTQLTITGVGFAGTPLKVIFNGSSIPVVSNTSTQIVATLNPTPSPGSYLVVVKSGNATGYSVFAVTASPSIAAQVALTNQTNAIAPTTLLTPTQNTLYRISIYMDCTLNSDQGGPELLLTWTDANGNQERSVSVASPSDPVSSVFAVRDTSGSPLSYQVIFTPAGGSYDVFFTIEQL